MGPGWEELAGESAGSVKSGGRRSTWGRLWKSPQEDSRRLLGGRAPPAMFLLIDSKLLKKERSRPEKPRRAPAAGSAAGSFGRDPAPAGRPTSGCARRLHFGEAGGSWYSLGIPTPTTQAGRGRTEGARRPRAGGAHPADRVTGGANRTPSSSPHAPRYRATPTAPGGTTGLADVFQGEGKMSSKMPSAYLIF